MSLSKPAPRKHIHTRSIDCRGYLREDGLWDIEGHITDVKTYSFGNQDRDGIQAGEPIHDMRIRITIDDEMVVHAAEAETAASPYAICGDITNAFGKIAGLKIGPGWRKSVTSAMGGIHGCTHLRDLLMGPVAVTAFQTVFPMREAERRAEEKANPKKERKPRDPNKKPLLLDTCYALRGNGPIAQRRWPDLFPKNEENAASRDD